MNSNRFDLIVVGAGMSGLTAAGAAAAQGRRVALISAGFGMFVFGAGCIESPMEAEDPPPDAAAIGFFCELARQAGCPFFGGAGERHYLPTILGSFQCVSLAPFSLWNGAAPDARRTAVVGIRGLSSFDAAFTAERLTYHARQLGLSSSYQAKEIVLSPEPGTVPAPLQFANRFDLDTGFRHELVEALAPIGREADLILLPGILGQRTGLWDIAQFEQAIGCRLCELPTLPPSIPGLRLSHALETRLRQMGVEFLDGFPVTELTIDGGRCGGVVIATPARPRRLAAASVILATGQFAAPLLGGSPLKVDPGLRPLSATGETVAANLYAIGALLPAAGERGGNQRAIVTGYRAGIEAAQQGGHYA